MVAEDDHAAAVLDEFDALAGIWAVANHVAKADNGVDAFTVNILENGVQRLEVAVDVADNGPLHVRSNLREPRFGWLSAKIESTAPLRHGQGHVLSPPPRHP